MHLRESILASANAFLFAARDCGELLLKAKAEVKHGQWLAWLKANVTCTPRTAQNYMAIVGYWPTLADKYETVWHLTLREAIKLTDEDSHAWAYPSWWCDEVPRGARGVTRRAPQPIVR